MNEQVVMVNEQFALDVRKGLSAHPKYLPSKYFYDEKGDKLFVKIMNMPEYYLTNSEFEIFSEQSDEIIESLGISDQRFSLFELGAGDGTKTIELLKRLKNADFTYKPIDISPFAIENLTERLKRVLPEVSVEGIQGEYFKVLNKFNGDLPKVILFLGSNIGNLSDENASDFFSQMSQTMKPGDKVLLGFDLKKSEAIVLPAYNDAQGFTRDFNLNLLERINRELGGTFDVTQFEHHPQYNEETGVAKSFLKSKKDQEVFIEKLDMQVSFKAGEMIHTEISRKYNLEDLAELIKNSRLSIHATFYDSKKYFCDVILKKGD